MQAALGQAFEELGATLEKKKRSKYWKVWGPNANRWYFIIEKNGALSLASEVPEHAFDGVIARPAGGHYGRFDTQITPAGIQEHYRGDLAALAAVAIRVLQGMPGAW